MSPFLSFASITLDQATPAVSNWSNQTFPTTHTVASTDLSAVLANPYTSTVAQPTGAITYSIVSGGSGTLSAGAVLYPGTYTVRASYAGDNYYIATTVDVTWTIINHPPVTVLTADVMDIAPGQTVNLTASATDIDGNMTSQTIDYLPPGSSSWIIGAAALVGCHDRKPHAHLGRARLDPWHTRLISVSLNRRRWHGRAKLCQSIRHGGQWYHGANRLKINRPAQ